MCWWAGDTASALRFVALGALALSACATPTTASHAPATHHAPAPVLAAAPSATAAEPSVPSAAVAAARHVQLDETTLEQHIDHDLSAVGSMSLGRPNAGALLNGVQLPADDRWEVVDRHRGWATQETVDYLVKAIAAVHEQFPGSHPLYVGHMSRESGGKMWPHRSHQSGRDVDISFFYVPDKAEWYRRATSRTLDRARTWAFLKALITETDVQYVFIDTYVQRLLRQHALDAGEDPGWIDTIFQYRSHHPEPIIRHVWGHSTHMHIRFYNPQAQALADKAFDKLVERNIVTPNKRYVRHRAREGDTLLSLAKHYGTSVNAIAKMNGIRGPQLRPGRLYTVPGRSNVRRAHTREIPARRLPPRGDASAPSLVAGNLNKQD